MTTDPEKTWEGLLGHAFEILDAAAGEGARAFTWTFGGGTVLMRRYRHRVSRDIDIFLSDPQILSSLSPRLNAVAEDKTSEYVEQAGSLKLYFESGEIDFIVAPPFTTEPSANELVLGREVRVETDAEIVGKKVEYRGDRFQARDFFDLACVVEMNADGLDEVRETLRGHRVALEKRIRARGDLLKEDFEAIDALKFRPTFKECISSVQAFLSRL